MCQNVPSRLRPPTLVTASPEAQNPVEGETLDTPAAENGAAPGHELRGIAQQAFFLRLHFLQVGQADGGHVPHRFEHERLTARMGQFFDRVESQLRQSLRQAAEAAGSATPTVAPK